MNYRLKYLTLITVTLIFSVVIPPYRHNSVSYLPSTAQTPTNVDSKTEADKLFQQGVQEYRSGKYSQALKTYERVLKIRRQLKDKAGIAQALNNMGEVYYWSTKYDKALEVLQQALTIRRELKDKAGEGKTLDNIGLAYYGKEQYDKALQILQQALAIRKEVKDKAGEGKTLSNIGNVYGFGLKKYSQALEYLQQALAIHKEVGNKFQTGITLFRIGSVYSDKEDYTRALEWRGKALVVNRDVGNREIEARTLLLMGIDYFFQNKYEQAIQFQQQTLAIAREIKNKQLEALALFMLGNNYSSLNKKDRSIEVYKQALAIQRELGNKPAQLEILNLLTLQYNSKAMSLGMKGLSAQAKVEYNRVIELAQETLTFARNLKNRKVEVNALTVLGRAYIFLKDNEKAIQLLEKAVGIARYIKDLEAESLALSTLALIYNNQGEYRKLLEIRIREVEIARKQDNKFNEVNSLINLANSYNVLSEFQKAVDISNQALAILPKVEINKLSPSLQEYFFTLEPSILDLLSLVHISLGKYDKALDFAQQAVTKAQSLNKPKLEANALLRLASLYTNYSNYSKDFPKAIKLAQQALTIAKKIKNPKLEAKALEKLSEIYTKQGNYNQALEFANQLLKISQNFQNSEIKREALKLLASIYHQQGNYQKALELAEKNLALVRQEKQFNWEVSALLKVSEIHTLLGNITQATENANQALSIARQRKDPRYERLALNRLARISIKQGKYEKAIKLLRNILNTARNKQYFLGEVMATAGLSQAYTALGENNKAIAVAQPAITRARKINNREKEGDLLISLGDAYVRIGDYTKGKDLVEQGLKIAKEMKIPALKSRGLNKLGDIYSSRNNYQKALELTQESLEIAENLKNPSLKLSALFNLGEIYTKLGQYQKSREYYQQAITTAKQLKNRWNESAVLLSIADTYFGEGQPQKTVEFAQQALTIAREIKVPLVEAFSYKMLSLGYGELGNDSKAMENGQRYLEFAKKVENSAWEKSTLSLIGGLHFQFGRKQEAIAAYQQALAIETDNQVAGANAVIYGGLGQVYRDLNQPNIAITYYKKAVNNFEEIRRSIEGLPPELQSSFLQGTFNFKGVKRSDIYRQLAELLISQKRDKEALSVQELLREQEIRDFSGETVAKEKPQIILNPTERKVTVVNQSIVALGKQLTECEKSNKSSQKCSQLEAQQEELLGRYYEKMKNLDKEIRTNRQQDSIYLDPKRGLTKIKEIIASQPDTVMIYPLVRDKELSIQIYAESGVAQTISVPVPREKLRKAVADFRKLMEECEGRTCSAADIPQLQIASQKLYNWLIKPIETQLQGQSVKNLVFALDRVTRYVPMAALYDGKQYLIEKYTVHVVPSAYSINVGEKLPLGTKSNRVLGMGLSEARGGFSALKNVPGELDVIVRQNNKQDKQGIYSGKEYLNNKFDLLALKQNLTTHNILHLATHGEFNPKGADQSYILLGDGKKLTSKDIFQFLKLDNTHLVVLSACQTALGGSEEQNGVEINAFAYDFLNKGAKAVIASLWLVSDKSTSELMQQFYKNLASNKTSITKSEALRMAQLTLLYSKEVKIEDIKRAGGITAENVPGENRKQSSIVANYAHPYYWAPFILIGNGL